MGPARKSRLKRVRATRKPAGERRPTAPKRTDPSRREGRVSPGRRELPHRRDRGLCRRSGGIGRLFRAGASGRGRRLRRDVPSAVGACEPPAGSPSEAHGNARRRGDRRHAAGAEPRVPVDARPDPGHAPGRAPRHGPRVGWPSGVAHRLFLPLPGGGPGRPCDRRDPVGDGDGRDTRAEGDQGARRHDDGAGGPERQVRRNAGERHPFGCRRLRQAGGLDGGADQRVPDGRGQPRCRTARRRVPGARAHLRRTPRPNGPRLLRPQVQHEPAAHRAAHERASDRDDRGVSALPADQSPGGGCAVSGASDRGDELLQGPGGVRLAGRERIAEAPGSPTRRQRRARVGSRLLHGRGGVLPRDSAPRVPGWPGALAPGPDLRHRSRPRGHRDGPGRALPERHRHRRDGRAFAALVRPGGRPLPRQEGHPRPGDLRAARPPHGSALHQAGSAVVPQPAHLPRVAGRSAA